METMLLSPNAATQKPVSKPGSSGTQTEGNEDFSPIMNEAAATVENTTEQQNTESQGQQEQPETVTTDIPTDTPVLEEANEASLFTTLPSAALASDNTMALAKTATVAVMGADKNTVLNTPTIDTNTTTDSAKEPTVPTDSLVVPPGSSEKTAPASKAESVLLQQIQQILDQGKESGTIVIRGNTLPDETEQSKQNNLQNLSNPFITDIKTTEIQAKQIIMPQTVVDDKNVSTPKSVKLEGAHQDVSEQFLNAKIGQSKGSASEGTGQHQGGQKGTNQNNKSENPQATAIQTTTVADGKPVDSSFGQQLVQNPVINTGETTSIEGKFAPGAQTPVPERELVSNLIQRFNINPRLQTSKLTMQLNPAELGNLKIDILVKGDSIKANIVAQSQQVLETLEKNMPRLRSVLEEQGFKIDSFEISMDGDGGSQKELFQEQFNSQQQEFASDGSSSQKTESFDTVLAPQIEATAENVEQTGINLTA